MTKESAIATVMAFYKVEESAATEMVGEIKDPATNKDAPTDLAIDSTVKADPTTGVDDIDDPPDPIGVDMSAPACGCGCGVQFNSEGDTDRIGVDSKSGVKQAPRPGGKTQQRTGPGGRPLTKLEKLVNWKRIEFCFNSSEQSLLGILMDGRQDIGRYFGSQLRDAEWESQEDISDLLLTLPVPAELTTRLEGLILNELNRIASIAAESIEAERAKQGDTIAMQADGFAGDGDKKRRSEAKRATKEAVEDARAQLASASLQTLGSGFTRDQMFDLFNRSIDEITGQTAQQSATMAATKTFAEARQQHVQSLVDSGVDEPQSVYYSAILDQNTCDMCRAADAEHGQSSGVPLQWNSDEHVYHLPPFQECLGGVRCRCILIYEWAAPQPGPALNDPQRMDGANRGVRI
jgi:hypothetical protein